MFETINNLFVLKQFFISMIQYIVFSITYLLLNTINFARSGICLSEAVSVYCTSTKVFYSTVPHPQ
jgi:hypothetical protein